jgi:hypothetical protein
MAASQPNDPSRPAPSVFLSYASEDRQSVQAIRDALPGLGLDVWYDESELGGGEAWDQKIRRQIRECDFFMPIISARTEARSEGYFRREWRFAVERTLDMADDHVFLVPVVIDNTAGETARVPEKFLTVQWSRLPNGQLTPAFEALCRRLAAGQTAPVPPPKKGAADPGPKPARDRQSPRPIPAQIPEFPRHEPGQNTRFYGQAAAWTVQSAWIGFQRLPRWLRIIVYCWVFVLLIRGCDSSDHTSSKRGAKAEVAAAKDEATEAKEDALSKAEAEKIKAITAQYVHGPNQADIAGLAAQIAQQVPGGPGSGGGAGAHAKNNLLAIPFSAPSDDQHAKGVADAVFGQLYGKVAIAQHNHVRLEPNPTPPADPAAAAVRGRATHSTYVVYGIADNTNLDVKVIESEDGSVEWSKSYPLEGADTAGIAAEVQENIPPDN